MTGNSLLNRRIRQTINLLFDLMGVKLGSVRTTNLLKSMINNKLSAKLKENTDEHSASDLQHVISQLFSEIYTTQKRIEKAQKPNEKNALLTLLALTVASTLMSLQGQERG